MTVTARKYNPGFLTDDELAASFCVRTEELESIVETLRECSGNANTHQIVIGPRGSGKTTLLLRVATEIRRDQNLCSRFHPVVFSEESYEVSSAGEFWLECLSRLAEQDPLGEEGRNLRLTYDELWQIQDDRTLAERCLGVLQDFADREAKRLVLIVENLNMLLGDIIDEEVGWQLRHTLQNEPRIVLLASATSRFEEIDKPDKALYDLFRVLRLRPLDREDCATLWQAVCGQRRAMETIQALRILTGGSPRLLTIVARFGAELSFRELMADLLNLVDDHTEYFKSHLDGLPAQERKVYLALVQLWKPVTAREVSDRARLNTSQCSAHLKRLTERGVVEVAGGTGRRKLYYVAERLYNIYYLMRRARGRASLIEALIRFMEAQYSPSELKDFVIRTVREAASLNGEDRWMHRMAFDRLLESPALSEHREQLSTLTSWIHPYAAANEGAPAALVAKALEVAKRGHESEAIAIWDEAVQRLGASEAAEDLKTIAKALTNKGTALYFLKRMDEAVAVWDDVVRRFGSSELPELIGATAMALTKKAVVLCERGREIEALAVCDEGLQRLPQDSVPQRVPEIAEALHSMGLIFRDLDQPEEALHMWDDLRRRFGESDDPEIRKRVCAALQDRSALLARCNRPEEALTAWDEVVEQFGVGDSPKHLLVAAKALGGKGTTLLGLSRFEEALEVWNDLLKRLGGSDAPDVLAMVPGALVAKGTALDHLNRPEEALEVWDEILRGPAHWDYPAVDHPIGVAIACKSALLDAMGRKEEGLAFRDEAIEKLGKSDEPWLVAAGVEALARIGAGLVDQNRFEEGLAVWDEAVERFGTLDTPMVRGAVAGVLATKGEVLARMNRPEAALAVWGDVVREFGSSDGSTTQEAVVTSLVCAGSLLADLNRPQEALAAMEDTIGRIGTTSTKRSLRIAVTTAMLCKARALAGLNRPEEAIAVFDEVLERHSGGATVESLGPVVSALIVKGALLVGLNREAAALAVWDDAVRRCGTSDHPMLQHGASIAQLKIAEQHLSMGRGEASVAALDGLFVAEGPTSAEVACQGHITRARAHLLRGEKAGCMADVNAALSILPELGFLPEDVHDGLCWLAVELGPAQLRELIAESPASSALFPLTTALEGQLGLETRVAKEVEEVAEDIQRDLEARKNAKRRRHD